MNKKMSKRQRDIKTKLMAAICMLLVSSIMMVSTTYAWFTLSTAPEVTGINTAVGANGNLEMALMPTDALTQGVANDYGITSSAGDSGKPAIEKNITWGNLVDLAPVANVDSYGLTKISMYPSALNAATSDAEGNPTSLADLMLKTPTYGADGRVDELVANAVTSTYDKAAQNFPQNSKYGVRAVGTASGMTDRQLAYTNARSTASTAMAQAKTLASQSLNTNGSRLADIALAHGVNANATHTQSDVTSLLAIVNDLLGTDGEGGKTGVIEYIETAYLNYIIAYGASQAAVTAGLDDTEFKTFQSAVTGAADVYAAASLCASNGVNLPSSVTTPLGLLEKTRESVESAKTDLETIQGYGSDATITWADDTTNNKLGISTPLYKLADTDAMEINGYAASTVKSNMSAIINSVASQGLNVVIASGGGVYADVADHCGDFNAAITIQKVEYNGLVLENMDATMATDSNQETPYLRVLGAAVETAKAPENAGGQTMPITDMYGYIIDLAFRTNAADSNLQLQVAAMDRIYGEEGGTETMGNGSNMTFTSTTSGFTLAQLKSLMKAIRIVFFDPTTKSVLATAALDADNGTETGGNTVKANMYLYEMKGTAGSRYEETKYVEAEAADTDYYVMNVTYSEVTGDASQVTEQLYVSDGNNGYVAAEYDSTKTETYYTRSVAYDGITDEEAKASTDMLYKLVAYSAGMNKLSSTKITALTQNTATAVSVLVYLDGNAVSNKDVAATAATSMTGTMNLQFSSSATLEPMNYTPLMGQGESYDVTVPTGVTGETKATEGKPYTFTVGTGYTLGTVTVGGTAVTPTAGENGSYTIGADDVTGDIVITVTSST